MKVQQVVRSRDPTVALSMTWRSSSTVMDVPVIMRDSGSDPDSVHRGIGGHSSSQQRQSTRLSAVAVYGGGEGFLSVFSAFFAFLRVVPELSASFRALPISS